MKQEVIETIKCARILYNSVTFISIAVFVYYETDLQKSIISLDLPFIFSFFALIGTSRYLFYTCGQNPGFVGSTSDFKPNQVELSIGREGYKPIIETKPIVVTDSRITITEIRVRSPEQARENELIDGKCIRKRSAEKDQIIPAITMRYCNECKVTQPYRSKHCKLCERCVHKFDHHCYWLGGCIGELNHRKFWFFLFIQSLMELWMCIIANSGLQIHYQFRVENAKAWARKNSSSYPISEYEILMVVTITIYITFLLTAFLLIFHSFLILTNQTTWEFLKREKISYLKAFPQGFHPFNKGYKTNLRLIFLHGNILRNWDLPPPPENGLKEKVLD